MAARVQERPRHETRVFYRSRRFEVDCDACGLVAAVGVEEEAEAIALLHEQFVAVLVEKWRMPH